MDLLKWDGSLSVDVEIIDEEHKKLIDYINRLYAAIEDGSKKKVIVELYEELVFYTNHHFYHEEDLFKNTDYPEIEKEAHILEHRKLQEKFEAVYKILEAGDVESFSNELMNFLVGWLVKHTQDVDMRYVPYLQKTVGQDK